ncbi:hypothetical protein AGMMS49975_19830 [Clostridia bacterium]|nr:hypothetical protein AGMMS49975_19830 [Clostridia bacterium]GHU74602.1 hypothetical protein FACS1894188_03330 [Clostridia bacterium]
MIASELGVGQVVFSKAGRDAGLPFVVLGTEENFVFLSDGKLRPLERPKKKKIIHIQKTNAVSGELQSMLQNGNAKNSDIIKFIRSFYEGR